MQRNTEIPTCFVFAIVGWLSLLLLASPFLQAADTKTENQFFRDGVLISLKEPSLAIDVKDSFTFVGRHPFIIRDVAAGERFVFVDTVGDIIEATRTNPKSESAATYRFLESKGYLIPSNWMMWRSLTIADHELKKEVILFYVENVDSTGLTLDDLEQEDEATDAWISIQKDLEVRANGSFRLAELNDDGKVIASAWSSIPNRFMQ